MKQLKKLHIDGKEYIYVVKGMKVHPWQTIVHIYESGNKGQEFCYLEFPEYTQVTPSMVKEALIQKINYIQSQRDKLNEK